MSAVGSNVSNAPIVLRVKRQDTPDGGAYWETFSIPYKPNMNVTSVFAGDSDESGEGGWGEDDAADL